MLNDSPKSYGLLTILLHWVCASLIIFLFGLGVYMRGLDYYSPWYHRGPELHIALGLIVAVLMSLRLIWRVKSTSPSPIPTISRANILAATLVKIALYAGVLLICTTGYFITTGEGDGAHFFDLFSVPAVTTLSADSIDLIGALHKYMAWGLMGLVALHALAAVFHHVIKKDKTLIRMLKTNP
jgi:cytochrome b561